MNHVMRLVSFHSLTLPITAAVAASTFDPFSAGDSVLDGPDDPQVNQRLYSEIIDKPSQFESIESSANTSTDARFRVERGEVHC